MYADDIPKLFGLYTALIPLRLVLWHKTTHFDGFSAI